MSKTSLLVSQRGQGHDTAQPPPHALTQTKQHERRFTFGCHVRWEIGLTALLCVVFQPWQAWGQPTPPAHIGKSHKGQVFVKLPTLQRLLRQSERAPGLFKVASFVPHRATYRGQMGQRSLTLHADLDVEVRTHPPRSIFFSLGGQGGLLTALQVDGQTRVPVTRSDRSSWILLAPGRHRITYNYHLKLTKSRGEHSLALHLPRMSKATLHLTFPGQGWSLRTAPTSAIQRKQSKTQSHFLVQLPHSPKFRLVWKGKRVERSVQTRFRAQVETLVTLKEGLLQGRTQLHYQVLTGALRTLYFDLPKAFEVLHVKGPGVVEWYESKIPKSPGMRRIVVQLSRAERRKQRLLLRFERTKLNTKKAISLPSLVIPKAEQYNGVLGVTAQADTEVSHHSVSGAREIDVRALPDAVRKRSQQPVLLAYRFAAPKHQIQVKVTKHPRVKVMRAVINRATFQSVYTKDGQELTKVTYAVINHRKQFLPVRLPPQSQLGAAFVAGRSVQPARVSRPTIIGGKAASPCGKDKPGICYLIPLVRSKGHRVGRVFQVELLYQRKLAALSAWGRLHSQIPLTPLEILSYRWTYYTPKTYWPVWFGGNIRSPWQRRFLRHLSKRIEADFRAGTPVLWAGGGRSYTSKYSLFSKKGLKSRFRRKYRPAAKAANEGYYSPYAKRQWQIRAMLPLVGRPVTFHGKLLRSTKVDVQIWYFSHHVTHAWYWLVFLLTIVGTLLLVGGLFHRDGVRWSWLCSGAALGAFLFGTGYLMPMTYLAGGRGLAHGFWLACLIRWFTLTDEQARLDAHYLAFARWAALVLTVLLLSVNHFLFDAAALALALPLYPTLLLKKQGKDEDDGGPTPPDGTGSDAPNDNTATVQQTTEQAAQDTSAASKIAPQQRTVLSALLLMLFLGLGIFPQQASARRHTQHSHRHRQTHEQPPQITATLRQTQTQGAWLPLPVYRRLRQQAKQRRPHRYLRIGHAHYSARLDKKGFWVNATLQLESRGPGWHTTPVLFWRYPLAQANFQSQAVSSASPGQASSRPARPRRPYLTTGYGLRAVWQQAWFYGSGQHKIKLRFFVPRAAGPDPKAEWKLAPAASNRLEVQFPNSSYRPSLKTGLQTQIVKRGTHVVLRTLLSSKHPQPRHWLSWWQAESDSPRLSKQRKRQARLYAKTYSLLSVGEETQELFFMVRYTIVHAPREQFKIRLPRGLRVRQVLGLGIRDYRMEVKKNGETLLDVLLQEPVTERYELSLLTEFTHKPKQKLRISLPQALGVQRETGHLGIEVVGNDAIQVQHHGAQAIDVQALPKQILQDTTRPILRAYRYRRRPIHWDIQVQRHQNISVPAATIDRATYTQVSSRQGSIWVRAVYSIRNTFKQFVAVSLPKGAQIRSAYSGGRSVKPARDTKGRVLIPLQRSGRSSGAAFSVELLYSMSSKGFGGLSHHRYVLPSLDLWVSHLSWRLHVPDGQYLWQTRGLGRERVRSYLSWNRYSLSSRSDIRQHHRRRRTQQQSHSAPALKIKLPTHGRSVLFSRYHIAPQSRTTLSLVHRARWMVTLGLGFFLLCGLLLGLGLARWHLRVPKTSLTWLLLGISALLLYTGFWMTQVFHLTLLLYTATFAVILTHILVKLNRKT